MHADVMPPVSPRDLHGSAAASACAAPPERSLAARWNASPAAHDSKQHSSLKCRLSYSLRSCWMHPAAAAAAVAAAVPFQHCRSQISLICTCSVSLYSALTESNKVDYGKDRERILIAVSVDLHGGATAVTAVIACLGMQGLQWHNHVHN